MSGSNRSESELTFYLGAEGPSDPTPGLRTGPHRRHHLPYRTGMLVNVRRGQGAKLTPVTLVLYWGRVCAAPGYH